MGLDSYIDLSDKMDLLIEIKLLKIVEKIDQELDNPPIDPSRIEGLNSALEELQDLKDKKGNKIYPTPKELWGPMYKEKRFIWIDRAILRIAIDRLTMILVKKISKRYR